MGFCGIHWNALTTPSSFKSYTFQKWVNVRIGFAKRLESKTFLWLRVKNSHFSKVSDRSSRVCWAFRKWDVSMVESKKKSHLSKVSERSYRVTSLAYLTWAPKEYPLASKCAVWSKIRRDVHLWRVRSDCRSFGVRACFATLRMRVRSDNKILHNTEFRVK